MGTRLDRMGKGERAGGRGGRGRGGRGRRGGIGSRNRRGGIGSRNRRHGHRGNRVYGGGGGGGGGDCSTPAGCASCLIVFFIFVLFFGVMLTIMGNTGFGDPCDPNNFFKSEFRCFGKKYGMVFLAIGAIGLGLSIAGLCVARNMDFESSSAPTPIPISSVSGPTAPAATPYFPSPYGAGHAMPSQPAVTASPYAPAASPYAPAGAKGPTGPSPSPATLSPPAYSAVVTQPPSSQAVCGAPPPENPYGVSPNP